MTQWYHPGCGAMKRPEAFLEILDSDNPLTESETAELRGIAEIGAAFRRVPRIDGIQHSPNSRARCRNCLEPIEKDVWRIKLVYFEAEAGMYNPAGYLHLTCSNEYFETVEILDRIEHFSDGLSSAEVDEIRKTLEHKQDLRN